MNINQQAVVSLLTGDEDTQSQHASSSSSSDSNQDVMVIATVPPQNKNLVEVLAGYALYKVHEKQEAILEFFKLSSFSTVFTSGDEEINKRVSHLCDSDRAILKRSPNGSKLPSRWTSQYCAEFIVSCVQLIKEDKLVRKEQSSRKSPRKVDTNRNLPSPARRLIEMVENTRLRVENKNQSSSSKTRKVRAKGVKDFLILNRRAECHKVTKEMIHGNLLCPLCNHQTLISLNTSKEIDKANNYIRTTYENRIKEWETKGRISGKPRMGKTECQVLGCVCYMQHCIGNSNGKGCF